MCSSVQSVVVISPLSASCVVARAMLLNKVVYVVVIILFPSFISSDSGASDCAVPVVIYFGERWREGGCLRQKIL